LDDAFLAFGSLVGFRLNGFLILQQYIGLFWKTMVLVASEQIGRNKTSITFRSTAAAKLITSILSRKGQNGRSESVLKRLRLDERGFHEAISQ